mmetsp:Transcript_3156/g.4808  ORF Transcript_3156/g.4808 Transcript_3156/m.4808 type:complete len:267 (-) Transcript_3156:406-1206(-)
MPKRSGTSIEEKPKIKKQKQSSLSGFFISSKKSTKDESKITAAEGKASSVKPKSSFPYKIFCDLDGVLVDFEAGVKKICNGKGPDDIPNQSYMWGAIARTPLFYQNLPWTKDGKQLWNAIKHTMPDILTGVPRSKNSRLEKAIWCQRELIEDGGDLVVNHVDMAGKKKSHEVVLGRKRENVVNVITCWSVNKYLESGERHVLIDDRESLADEWKNSGGIFIHHTKTERTLELLKKQGILSPAIEKPSILVEEEKTDALYDLPPDTP